MEVGDSDLLSSTDITGITVSRGFHPLPLRSKLHEHTRSLNFTTKEQFVWLSMGWVLRNAIRLRLQLVLSSAPLPQWLCVCQGPHHRFASPCSRRRRGTSSSFGWAVRGQASPSGGTPGGPTGSSRSLAGCLVERKEDIMLM